MARNDFVVTLWHRVALMKGIAHDGCQHEDAARHTLNLRIPAAARHLIDRAAESSGKMRTDFILEAARRAAEEALLDRALLVVGPEAYDQFLKRLDRPASPNERLQRTMRSKVPWKHA